MTSKERAQRKIREWRENPIQFVREVFRAEPDAWQADYLDAFRTHDRLASKACKGPGKTCVLAWCAWHFLLTRPHPKVVATSITGDNLADGLWTEMSKWQKVSPMLTKLFQWNKERITSKEHPETWWMSARTWKKDASPEQQADTLAGLHADYLLFIIDEAGGVPDSVVAAAEAGLANADKEGGTREAKMLIAGNPTLRTGPLWRACTVERHLWWVQEISSDPDDPKRTPRVSKEWAQIQIDKYGRDNPWVLVNVFGQFPRSQSNTLVSAEDVEEASRRVLHPKDYLYYPKILAVDVARFGDDRTIFTLRQGPVIYRQREMRNLDNMEVATITSGLIAKHRPAAVFVDENGVGSGVVDGLRYFGHEVRGVMSQKKASSEVYLNKRAEMWAKMGEWMKTGCIPNDPELKRELSLPTYSFTSSGQIKMESKDDIKKRGHPSPDKGDSASLTFAENVEAEWLAQPEGSSPFTSQAEVDYDPLRRH